MKSGYVYVLGNTSLGKLLKIGRTERDPDARVAELSSATGIPTPFYVIYKRFFDDCVRAEAFVHAQLGEHGYRTSDRREFFDVEIDTAIDALRSASEMLEKSDDKSDLEIDAYIELLDEALSSREQLEGLLDEIHTDLDEIDTDDTKFRTALDESRYAWIQLLDFYEALSAYDELAEGRDPQDLNATIECFNAVFRSLGDVVEGMYSDYPDTDDLMDVLRAAGDFYTGLDEDDSKLKAQTERLLQEINAWYRDSDDKLSELPGSLPSLHIVLAGFYNWCRLLGFHYCHAQVTAYRSSEFATRTREQLELDVYDEDDWVGATLTHVSGLQAFNAQLDSLFDDLRIAVKRELALYFCDFDERIEHFRPLFRSYRKRRENFRQSISDLRQRTFGNDEDNVGENAKHTLAVPYNEILSRAIEHQYGNEEKGVLSDPSEARRLLKAASHMGSARADWELGQMALESNSSDRVDQAVLQLKDYARKGEALGHLELAILFADRHGRNAKMSVSNYLRAAELNSETPSRGRCWEILHYLSQVTKTVWPVPEALVCVFAPLQSSLMREFAIDLAGLGILNIISEFRFDREEATIDRVEDCLDQMNHS